MSTSTEVRIAHPSTEFMDGTPAEYLQAIEPGQRCRFGLGGVGIGKNGECVGVNSRGNGWMIRDMGDGRLYDVSGKSWIIPLTWDDELGEYVATDKKGGKLRLPEVGKARDPKSQALRRGTSQERRATKKPDPLPAPHADHGEEIAKQIEEEAEDEATE